MRFILLFLTAGVLSACAIGTGVRLISFNGESIFEAKCNGTSRTYGDCLEQASEKCADQNKKAVQINTGGNSTLMTMNGQLLPVVSRSLLFKCE